MKNRIYTTGRQNLLVRREQSTKQVYWKPFIRERDSTKVPDPQLKTALRAK